MILWFYRFIQFCLKCIFGVWNRFQVFGSESLPAAGGYILASNHASYLDPPLFGAGVWRPITFLAKEELFRVGWLSALIRPLGAMPIAGESDFKTIRAIVRSLKAGSIVCIFPEGTRSETGEIRDTELKGGVAFLAHAAGVPIVPVYLDGTDKAWPRGGKSFKPAKIRMFIGAPMIVRESPEAKADHYDRFAREVVEQIKLLRDSASDRGSKKGKT